jgi:rhodanese-related sulfurtransferase
MKSRFIGVFLLVLPAAFMFAQQESPYVDPANLARLISDKGAPYILVDVRTPEEYASGHIPTAVNIPVSQIAEKPPTDDKAALIIVYCRSGARSTTAKRTLDQLGYTDVVNFRGIGRWDGQLVEGESPGETQP